MDTQLGVARKEDFSRWDRFKMLFVMTHIEDDHTTWTLIRYKIYKQRKVILSITRYH